MTQNTVKHISKPAGAKAASTILIFGLLVLLAVSGCKNPLVGLGPRVDVDPPDGDVTSVDPGNYVKGPIKLEGTVTDDTGASSVYMKVDGQRIDGVVDGETWSIDVDTMAFADGEKDIRIYLVDTTGKENEERLLLFFDNTAPVLMITDPLGYASTEYSDYSIAVRGEAYDGPYGRIREVRSRVFIPLAPTDPNYPDHPDSSVASITAPVGTSTWSSTFNNTGGLNTHYLELIAVDYAGNESVWMYNFDDVYIANGNNTLPIEELFYLETEQTDIPGVPLSATDLHLIQLENTDGFPLMVNMAGDEPVISLINPDSDLGAVDPLNPDDPANIMAPGGTIIGTVEDDDRLFNIDTVPAINPVVQIQFDASGAWLDIDPDFNPLTTPEDGELVDTSPQFLRFEYPLTGFTVGDHSVRIRAEDINGVYKETSDIGFTIDPGAPLVDIITPNNGDFLNESSFTNITGTATAGTPITEMTISLDGGTNYKDISFTSSTSVAWTYTVAEWIGLPDSKPAPADGQINVKVRAKNSTGISYANLQFTQDSVPPWVEIQYPSKDSYVNGRIYPWAQAYSDNTLVTKLEYVIGQYDFLDANLIWTEVDPDDFNKFYIHDDVVLEDGINTQSFEDDTNSQETPPLSGSGVWKCPIRFRAEDQAGNVYLTTLDDIPLVDQVDPWSMLIDNSLDSPQITILNPSAGQSYGGSLIVAGTTFDDDGLVDLVEVQIDISTEDGSPGFNNIVNLGSQGGAGEDTDYNDGKWYIDFNGNGSEDPGEQQIDESQWHTLAGKGSWSFQLNQFGELYDTDGVDDDGDGQDHGGVVHIRVRTTDQGGVVSAVSELSFRFDDSIPYIENLNFESNDYAGGAIILRGDVKDDDQITEISISYNNGITYVTPPISSTSDTNYEGVDVSGNDWYTLQVDIDTTTYIPDSGILYLKLKAVDDTPYVVYQPISLNVDNKPPTIAGTLGYTGQTASLSGTVAALEGEMKDSGTVSGIEKVEVYLERGLKAYNPSIYYDYDDDATHGLGKYNEYGEIAMSDRDFDNGTGEVEVTALYPSDPNAIITIDSLSEEGDDSGDGIPVGEGIGDGDGYNESLSVSLGIWTWGVEIRSDNIPDGTVNVHYVIYDKGGNTAHYVEQVFIANNAPYFSNPSGYVAEVGTDINGDNDADDLSEKEYYAGSGTFTVRNNFLTINPLVSGGNGTLDYELYYGVNDTGILISTDSSDEIEIFSPLMNDGINKDYYFRITDEVDLFVEANLKIDLANNDSIDPETELNLVTQSDVPNGGADGHLEAAGDSTFDGADADISGSIVFSGKVSDEQRVQHVVLTISEYDGGNGVGQPFLLFSWDGDLDAAELIANPELDDRGGLVPQIAGAQITYHSLTESVGHQADWEFTWNSATLDNIAAQDVEVSISAFDFGSNTNVDIPQNLGDLAAVFNSMTVDVVPYIRSITRNPFSYNTIRSAYGKYSLQQGEGNILVEGFNILLPTTQDVSNWVRIYSAAIGGNADATTLSVEADPVPTANAFEMAMNASSLSGYLRLAVNGVEAINAINDNGLDWNKEDDGNGISSTKWNDDRYLVLFEIGDYFRDSNDPEHPSLSINTSANPDRLYGSWTNYAGSRAYVGGPESGGGWADRDALPAGETYDPPEWTDLYVDGDGDRHAVILENYVGGTTSTNWGFLSSTINGGGRRRIDDMGDDTSVSVDHSDGYDEMLYQFRNPRISVLGNGAANDMYVSYYDYWARALKYSRIINGAATFVSLNNMMNGNTVVDGEDDFNNDPSDSGDDVGFWSDIQIDNIGGTDATGTHVPVIVYYDTTNHNLKIARGKSSEPVGTGGWNIEVIPNSNYVGQYVSMKMDSSGNLHISAFRNSTGDLIYIYVANINGVGSYDFATTPPPVVVVDAEGSVGPWTDLALDGSDSPIISYLNLSAAGTFDGLKYAYVRSGNGQASDDWEAMVVPADSSVASKRSGIVYSGNSNWDGSVALSYGSSNFEIVYIKNQVP